MNQTEIASAFEGLQHQGDGWWSALPESYKFCNQPVRLVIQTESVPTPNTPPPSPELRALSETVLANIDAVLERAESEFRRHHAEYPEVIESVANPHFWVNIDAMLDDGPTRWSFIVESKFNPDYGTHIEFDGLECLDIWGGD